MGPGRAVVTGEWRVGRAGTEEGEPTFFFNLQSSIFMRGNKNFRCGIKFQVKISSNIGSNIVPFKGNFCLQFKLVIE